MRRPDSHKGENGKVLIIGGSLNYQGAPILVGMAALRTGSDIALLLVPKTIFIQCSSFSPNLIVRSYDGDFLNRKALNPLKNLEEEHNVLVIGNGLSKKETALSTSRKIIERWEKPMVVDGDALQPNLPFHKQTIITPHFGEFKRLTGQTPSKDLKDRGRQVKEMAKELNCILLLKGRVDIISDGRRLFFNKTGNPGMTVGGTGDVLAGIAASLLSQGFTSYEAACAAARINGMAGDLCFKEKGYGLLATDIIETIPKTMKGLSLYY